MQDYFSYESTMECLLSDTDLLKYNVISNILLHVIVFTLNHFTFSLQWKRMITLYLPPHYVYFLFYFESGLLRFLRGNSRFMNLLKITKFASSGSVNAGVSQYFEPDEAARISVKPKTYNMWPVCVSVLFL